MVDIKRADIGVKSALEAGQAAQKIATRAASAGGNPWKSAESIIDGINLLLDKALVMKNQGAPAAVAPGPRGLRTIMINDTPAPAAITPAPAPGNSEAKQNMSMAAKGFLQFLTDHIEKCRVEDPNMTISDCLAKMPVNVTQLSVLLTLAGKRLEGDHGD